MKYIVRLEEGKLYTLREGMIYELENAQQQVRKLFIDSKNNTVCFCALYNITEYFAMIQDWDTRQIKISFAKTTGDLFKEEVLSLVEKVYGSEMQIEVLDEILEVYDEKQFQKYIDDYFAIKEEMKLVLKSLLNDPEDIPF